jgi:hypothetical protein
MSELVIRAKGLSARLMAATADISEEMRRNKMERKNWRRTGKKTKKYI